MKTAGATESVLLGAIYEVKRDEITAKNYFKLKKTSHNHRSFVH
jgi:hypothetical protein